MLANPFKLSDEDGYVWLKGNLHCHTTNSDGCVSPQDRIDSYFERGYDFLALTDHDSITRADSLSVPEGFVLIQGAELHPPNVFGGQLHHFVALGIHADIDARNMAAQQVIDEILGQGGQPWLAHPYWSSVNMIRDILPFTGLMGMEVFNATCGNMAHAESSVHWDDWMSLLDRPLPAIATDDAHWDGTQYDDTYLGWTMVRVNQRSAPAILQAIKTGASYSSAGPEIHDIQIHPANAPGEGRTAHVQCSQAQRVQAVCDLLGSEYHGDAAFEKATLPLRPDARWVRFEVIDPTGRKAWSNPFTL